MYRPRLSLWKAVLAGLASVLLLCVAAADGPPSGDRAQQVQTTQAASALIAATPPAYNPTAVPPKTPVAAPVPVPTSEQPLRLDIGKTVVEMPLKGMLSSSTSPVTPAPVTPAVADRGKGRIERPVEKVVASATAPANKTDNPRVEPGKVKWHKDFAAACAAGKKSGKPVLLFQMMGKLDEKFC